MIIPDYLIIDEIQRREEKKWQPEGLRLPLYDVPDDNVEYPTRQAPAEPKRKPKKNNGVIIIDMGSYERIG